MVMGKQYWNRKEIEKAIMLNAVMIERLPLLPFERGLALTASEKAGALDLADVENRVLLSAGLADEYQLAEFSQEYASYAIPHPEPPKDKFEERQRQRDATAMAQIAFISLREKYASGASKYAVTPVVLTLSRYDFGRQSFMVQPRGGYQGYFPVSLFRNIPDPQLIKGTGSSSFERVVSSRRAYQVTRREWPVLEPVARRIGSAEVTVYARAYWDISHSNSSGRGVMVYCTQLDLYLDPEMSIPAGESGCQSLNVKIDL